MGRLHRAPASALLAASALLSTSSLLAAGCSGGGQEVVVSAASSLTDALEALAPGFEAAHPGVEVTLNLDSSATLAEQIEAGAPVDVFASADLTNAEEVVASGAAVDDPVRFASNELVVVARAGNDLGLTGAADLERIADAGEVVALCAGSAPCGRLADELLDLVGSRPTESSVTRAPNARATLAAVTRGDAAAALVYRSDALSAGDRVELVESAGAPVVSTDYFATALADGPAGPDLAADFVGMLTSAPAQALLAQEGFG